MLLASLFLFIEQPKTLIFIAVILILFFGAKRIPEMMRGLGQGVREFKDATKAPQEQPMNPGGYAAQNPGYQQQNAPYGQPDQAHQYPQQPQYPAQPHYPSQPQHPVPTTPGYQPAAPVSQVPPAAYNPNESTAS